MLSEGCIPDPPPSPFAAYNAPNSDKIKDVPTLLRDYQGQEELMIAKIADKYGVDLAQPLQPQPEAEVTILNEIEQIFEICPKTVSNVSSKHE